MQDGPSGLGLALGLAQTGLGAYSSAQAAKAPKGFIDQPNPGNKLKVDNTFNNVEWTPQYRNLP